MTTAIINIVSLGKQNFKFFQFVLVWLMLFLRQNSITCNGVNLHNGTVNIVCIYIYIGRN